MQTNDELMKGTNLIEKTIIAVATRAHVVPEVPIDNTKNRVEVGLVKGKELVLKKQSINFVTIIPAGVTNNELL